MRYRCRLYYIHYTYINPHLYHPRNAPTASGPLTVTLTTEPPDRFRLRGGLSCDHESLLLPT
jgi:hypothetical protein